jgi:acetolactate synthase-1/2/3 large subunit
LLSATRIDLLRPGFQSPVAAVGYPDFAAYAKACGGDGYRVETPEQFERAFAAAVTSGRPTLIDAKITRWTFPHYSSSLRGVIPGCWETLEERFRRG